MALTVAGLIAQLRSLPPELPVYIQDREGYWEPFKASDVWPAHFTVAGKSAWSGEWFNGNTDEGPINGVGLKDY